MGTTRETRVTGNWVTVANERGSNGELTNNSKETTKINNERNERSGKPGKMRHKNGN